MKNNNKFTFLIEKCESKKSIFSLFYYSILIFGVFMINGHTWFGDVGRIKMKERGTGRRRRRRERREREREREEKRREMHWTEEEKREKGNSNKKQKSLSKIPYIVEKNNTIYGINDTTINDRIE